MPAPEAGPEAAANPYSPWGIDVHENDYFNVVTFKDVGLGHFPEYRAPILEAIAEVVALHMSVDADPVAAHPLHEPAFADPNSHLYCEMEHIYVDVWSSNEPDRWGYSLWSGCTASDRFAWEEVPFDASADANYIDALIPLGESIAETILEANRTGCFTESC